MRGREPRLVTVTVTVLIGLTSPDCCGARRHRAYHDGLHPCFANANVAGRALARELASSGGVTESSGSGWARSRLVTSARRSPVLRMRCTMARSRRGRACLCNRHRAAVPAGGAFGGQVVAPRGDLAGRDGGDPVVPVGRPGGEAVRVPGDLPRHLVGPTPRTATSTYRCVHVARLSPASPGPPSRSSTFREVTLRRSWLSGGGAGVPVRPIYFTEGLFPETMCLALRPPCARRARWHGGPRGPGAMCRSS
jgi:hypothetical protein